MNYWARIGGALAVSSLINLALLTLLPHLVRENVAVAHTDPAQRAIRLDFRPSEPQAEQPPPDVPKRLIDAGAPAETPPAETDLISSQDTQAQDNSDAPGDESKPAVDELDDFDELGTPPIPPSESPPEPVVTQPEPETETSAEAARPEQPPAQPDRTAAAVAAIPQAQPELSEIRNEPPLPRTPEADSPVAPLEALAPPEQQPDPQRFRVAEAAPPAPSMPVQELRSSRGRQEGGTFNSGFTSFEANKHELGEYMLHVRSLVEREWRLALRLRYTGVSRTDAVIECSIRPDGTLEYARVLEPGTSLTFAVLCRQAIEQAAPFGPFPFEVPEIYRKENLEITWRFSYL